MIQLDKGNKRKIYLFSGIAVGCVLLLYLAFSLFFMEHYFFGTRIGDFQCGGKTPEEVKAFIKDRAAHYVLTIQGRDGEELLTASQIGIQFLLDDTPEKIIGMQNGFAWISSLWNDESYEMPVTVSYEESLMDDCLANMDMFQKENMRKPANAYIGEYNRELGAYEIISGDLGTLADVQKVKIAVSAALNSMNTELVLEEADCYVEPEIPADNEDLVRFKNRLNRFVSSRIVYDWNGTEEIVNGDLIQEWLKIDRKRQLVTIDPEPVREYVDGLSKKYDTYGRARKFQTSEGRNIILKPGNYGWRVDRNKEAEKLIKLIRSGSQVNREPAYLYMAAVKGEDDIGDSYVEIDLTAQHLYLYVEGELITESDFVSGNVAKGYDTPEGVYGLTYKTLNATLRGPGYATPVTYWMPFNGNVGMHYATWRGSFGGSIYLRNGSHGCINLPKEQAEKIYEQIYKGFPVICYKDEYTEEDTKKDTKKESGKSSEQKTENNAEIPEQNNSGAIENGSGETPVPNPGNNLPIPPTNTEIVPPADTENNLPADSGNDSTTVPGDIPQNPPGNTESNPPASTEVVPPVDTPIIPPADPGNVLPVN